MATRPKPDASPDIFWAEIAPCEHLVQVYEDEGVFLEGLANFVGAGLTLGEAVVIIANASHRASLEARLQLLGHVIHAAKADRRYLAIDAADMLSRFMVDGWPDPERFEATIRDVLRQVLPGCKVRAFGEMVALLWARGDHGATVRLEHLWDEFCNANALALFCAYPRIGATRDLNESLAEVCALHSRIVT